MKMILRALLACIAASASTTLDAQEPLTRQLLPGGITMPAPFTNASRNIVSCGPDTILYPYLKELAFTAPNDSFFVDAMVGNVRTAAQAYHLNQQIEILGVQFWGGAYTTSAVQQSLLVRAYLYAVDAMNMPIAMLDSADVTVSGAYDFYEAIFDAPYAYGSNFAVGIRSVPNDTLAVISNNAGNVWSPNYGEGLAWRRFGSGIWNSALSFFGQDLEYMIFPIVQYEVDASFSASADSACSPAIVNFTNTSSPIFSNHMFNLLGFDEYFGFATSDSAFSWSSGSGWETAFSWSDTFLVAGTYSVQLSGNMTGYFTSCADTMLLPITIHPLYADTVTASICPGESYQLGNQTLTVAGVYNELMQTTHGCDSSVNLTLGITNINTGVTQNGTTLSADLTGASYQWIDCANGNPVTGATGQSFNAQASGNYAVIITTGCSDTSACFNIDLHAGTNDLQINAGVYPNPAQELVTINTYGLVPDMIVLSDALGREIRSFKPASSVVDIMIGNLDAGIYMVRIASGNISRTIKIVKQ